MSTDTVKVKVPWFIYNFILRRLSRGKGNVKIMLGPNTYGYGISLTLVPPYKNYT